MKNESDEEIKIPVLRQPDKYKELYKPQKLYKRILPRSFVYFYADVKQQIERLQNYRRLRKRFYEKLGYTLNLQNPRSYNEKINWKKLYDRNPLLIITADKYEVRSYLRKVLGEQEAEKYLIPLYYVTDKPDDIPFDKLPDSFVIKPNHGSWMHLIVRNKSEIIPHEVVALCKNWLSVHFGLFTHEWAYRNIKRKIIIEKLLLTEDNELPGDYRFFCFHGVCRFIRVSHNRFTNDDSSIFLDTSWNTMPVYNPGYSVSQAPFEKPAKLEEMISLAEKISKDFDSVRVDLYYCNENIYFGELTHYRGNGFASFEPQHYDFQFGEYWKLEPGYWKK